MAPDAPRDGEDPPLPSPRDEGNAAARPPRDDADAPVPSPCISVCVLDPAGSGVCVGCGRTLDEIAAWSDLTNRQKREVVARLPARLATLAARNRERHWDDDAKR